jgi:putative acetyltransferase
MITIREEALEDRPAIREVNELAFGTPEEAALVDRLRSDGLVLASLVACDGGEVAGHILFSALPIGTVGRTVRGAALAPMAVRPDRQRLGIGSALVHQGLEACRALAVEVAVVLGHPAYYPRFGFSAETARHLEAPFSGPAFMALELTPGVLDGVSGSVRYPPAFGLSDD